MKKMSPVLKEIILGILICGVVFQLSLMWLAEDKLRYTTGLWIGVIFSVFKIIHMECSVQNALERDQKGAANYTRMMYGLRMIITVVVIGVTWYFNLGNIIALFLGMMTLQAGAFLQVPLHSLKNRKCK
ncbi:MAG: ATP synthase subunit I [Lachnospiraceae bacterium]|nr:ATP synthase subunit I [Robinsoniella sp.]MDY3765571.1 ATP synthase subunit I [Lachnospiraceae bacterium]